MTAEFPELKEELKRKRIRQHRADQAIENVKRKRSFSTRPRPRPSLSPEALCDDALPEAVALGGAEPSPVLMVPIVEKAPPGKKQVEFDGILFTELRMGS